MDATYRTELKELNELNFARFDDKLERRLTEFQAGLDGKLGQLGKEIDNARVELIKWMFVFWVGTVASIVALGRFVGR